MKIEFNIRYFTRLGEHISVVIGGEEPTIVALSTVDGEVWRGGYTLPCDTDNLSRIEYSYALYRGEELLRREILSIPHTIDLLALPEAMCVGAEATYVVDDVWRDLPRDNYRYSAAFSTFDASSAAEAEVATFDSRSQRDRYVTFRVLSPALAREGLRLALSGNNPLMGGWDECSALPMREISANLWSVTIPLSDGEQEGAIDQTKHLEYKFVAVDIATNRIVEWERGENRHMWLGWVAPRTNYITEECEIIFSDSAIRIAGSAIPLFSLRSEGGCGVGDFGDLKQYICWAAQTGQRAVQILPINDTTISYTWQDSYPYNSISIYAFNPMYIDLRALPPLAEGAEMAKFEQQRIELNNLPEMDYEAVCHLKRGYLQRIFEQEGAAVLNSTEFAKFFEENRVWLQPYAAFSILRDESGSANFNTWSRYSRYDAAEIEDLCAEDSVDYSNIAYYYYIQYILHCQLLEAATEARRLGVILKGDIPIGISRESVEAWVEPHYFNMNGQAGAPPDAFSVNGQNWGFPTYNWEVMQRDNYLWWRRRFAKMAEYFTAYRIDHILGFFRIWEIPQHSVHGLLGQFAPALPMSPVEIESWGVPFQREFMTEPFINDAIIDELFGQRGEEVRSTYLQHLHHDIYSMRKEFSTQRLIEAHFRGADDDETLQLKESLYALVSNVLFVKDHHDDQLYHPRIAVQDDFIFKQLNEGERAAFNRLYNHYYYERHNAFWYSEAMKKLPVLTCSTSMLVCGEDLGMVPDCVAPVMEQLQIISLEIERMPKSMGEEFGRPSRYPHSSVCTIGTHDMSTLRGWLQEDNIIRARYLSNELGLDGGLDISREDAPAWLCADVVKRHLDSPSMLVILTWQDWMSIDESLRNQDIDSERINIPANPRHYWRWRMHLTLEQLQCQTTLNNEIERLITSSHSKLCFTNIDG